MSKLTVITDRAFERVLDLASQASNSLRHAGQSLQQRHPNAKELIGTSVTLEALRSGSQVVKKMVRRNPTIAILTATVGLGLIGYGLYRKRKQAQASLLEGVIEHPIEELQSGYYSGRSQAYRISNNNRLTQARDHDKT